MWRLGFFFHEMAFGLLSIFLPLRVISIGGTLVDIGIMSAGALFLAIPFSIFWGYLCDKKRRYKRYILLSFSATTVLLYLLALSTNVALLVLLYIAMSIFHVAHEAPKNVLIAELYSHDQWTRKFAFYEGLTETGWLVGLLFGFFTSTWGFGVTDVGATYTLLLCCILNFIALITSILLVKDPLLVFERGLVSIEKTVEFASRGVFLATKIFDGVLLNEKLRKENVTAFCSGLVLFSFATSILFTPMPVFISNVVKAASLPESLVFAIFVLNSSGATIGYFFAGSKPRTTGQRADISRIIIVRGFLTFLLIATVQASAYNVVLAATVLILMGFVYALFLVHTLSLSMELIPAGKAGLFNALVGIGGACGSFIGPLLAQTSFSYVFITSGLVFLAAYAVFKVLV